MAPCPFGGEGFLSWVRGCDTHLVGHPSAGTPIFCCSQLGVLGVSAGGSSQPKCRPQGGGSQLRAAGLGGRRPSYNPFAEQT